MLRMNHKFFENLVASSVFDRLLEVTQQLINNVMSSHVETASARGSIASLGATPEVVNMEAPAAVPKSSRSPRPKPTPVREVPKTNKCKQKKKTTMCK